jgi:hypothetical protein
MMSTDFSCEGKLATTAGERRENDGERKIEDGAMRKDTEGNGRKQREGWRGREGGAVEVVQGPKAKAELHRGPLTSIAIQS